MDKVDILKEFIILAPADWVDSLDGWFVAQELAPPSQYQLQPRRNAQPISARPPLRTAFFNEEGLKPLEQQLLKCSDRGRIEAMKTFAPFLGSLGLSLLEGHYRARNAMLHLAKNETAWTKQACAIIDAGDLLLGLYDSHDVGTFERLFSGMNRKLLQSLLFTLFCNQQKPLDKNNLLEQTGAIAWGPIEVARVLFESKFNLSTDREARRVNAEVIIPAKTELEHAVVNSSAEELIMHLKRCMHFNKIPQACSLREDTIQAVFGFGLNLFLQGIALDVNIPSSLSFRTDFHKQEFYSLLKVLLRFVHELRDMNRADHFIRINWDNSRRAIVIEDNGRGTADITRQAMPADLEKAQALLKGMAWKMTLESESREWTRFTIHPRLGDIAEAGSENIPQAVSGPPQYEADAQTAGLEADVSPEIKTVEDGAEGVALAGEAASAMPLTKIGR